jgi:hypothetical protein
LLQIVKNIFKNISNGCSFSKDNPTPTIVDGIPHPNTEYMAYLLNPFEFAPLLGVIALFLKKLFK